MARRSRGRDAEVNTIHIHSVNWPGDERLHPAPMTAPLRILLRTIGAHVAALREARGWRQSDLAAELHVHERTVGNLETGTGNPSIAMLTDVATLFGVEVRDLLEPIPLTKKRPGRRPNPKKKAAKQ